MEQNPTQYTLEEGDEDLRLKETIDSFREAFKMLNSQMMATREQLYSCKCDQICLTSDSVFE